MGNFQFNIYSYLFLAYVSEWYVSGGDLCHAVRSGEVILRVGDRLQITGVAKRPDDPPYYHWAVVVMVSNGKFVMMHVTSDSEEASSGASPGMMSGLLGYFGGGASASVPGGSMALQGAKGNATLHVEEIQQYERRIRVNNQKDRERNVLSDDQIRAQIQRVQQNKALVGEYNLITNNCEDLVNYIRYGVKESDQVPQVIRDIFSW